MTLLPNYRKLPQLLNYYSKTSQDSAIHLDGKSLFRSSGRDSAVSCKSTSWPTYANLT